MGSLGIKHLAAWNKAFLLKLLWIVYQRKDTPWVDLVWGKYLHNCPFDSAEAKPYYSPFWKSLLSLKDHLLSNICIKVRNGETTSFWFDKWLPSGPLALQLESEPPALCSHFRVSDFFC